MKNQKSCTYQVVLSTLSAFLLIALLAVEAMAAPPVRLTMNPGEDVGPAWDPASNTVAYARSRDVDGVGAPRNVWEVQADDPTSATLMLENDDAGWFGDSLSWQGNTSSSG